MSGDRLRGLSSAGRAPALQAGCRRFDSVRLHQTSLRPPWRSPTVLAFAGCAGGQAPPSPSDLIGKRLRFPVQSDAGSGTAAAFTSFREIISVVGRTRVGVRWSPVLRDWEPTAALSKSSTLTKSSSSDEGGNSCMLIWKEDCPVWDGRRRDAGLSSSGSNQAR